MENNSKTPDVHATLFEVTGNIYDHLKERCDKIGISVSQMAKKAGVTRSTLARWKDSEPLSIKQLRNLHQVLAEEEFKQSNN